MSERSARRIAGGIEPEGTTAVKLVGAAPPELILAEGRGRAPVGHVDGDEPDLLALCDWRSLACPSLPDETFAVVGGGLGDAATIAAAAGTEDGGPYQALKTGSLMALPSTWAQGCLRALT